MNYERTDQADRWYRMAEQKGAHYFASLYAQVRDKTYVPALTEDFELWKKDHIHASSWLSLLSRSKRKPESSDYKYIQWLNSTGKLDAYLERSVSYIYMRDLGKALDSPDTQTRIQRVVGDIKNYLLQSTATKGRELPEYMSVAGAYRWAQKEG